MFHHDWIVSQLAQEHRRDVLRQAEQSRRAKQARAARVVHGHVFHHVLDWAGRRMIIVGGHLQARHAARHNQTLIHTSRG